MSPLSVTGEKTLKIPIYIFITLPARDEKSVITTGIQLCFSEL